MIEYNLPGPRWMRELARVGETRTEIFVTGNVKDYVHYPVATYAQDGSREVEWRLGTLEQALFEMFGHSIPGYGIVASYDRVDSLRFADADMPEPRMADLYAQIVNDRLPRSDESDAQVEAEASGANRRFADRLRDLIPRPENPADQLGTVLQQMRTCVTNSNTPCAFIINHIAELTTGNSALAEEVRLAFLRLIKASQESLEATTRIGDKTVSLPNLIIITCDRVSQLPPWLYLDNPFSAIVTIEDPSREERAGYFSRYLPEEMIASAEDGGWLDVEELADLTDGMSLKDLMAFRRLCVDVDNRGLRAQRLVDMYRYGDRESLWSGLPWDRLDDAEAVLSQRVIGQPAAVSAVADVLRRSRLHLSGRHASGKGSPRGVLFFAGPTGVGKTELAMAVAELVFSTEDACVRFDMSEYGQEHADQRMLGAPPGYVGYEAGGQLTNAVRENPFSVLLFDEIDKAHPSILDKFLQILEDGRITDGQGETVYFSESIIVFTSNIGMYYPDARNHGRPLTDADGKAILRVDHAKHTEYADVSRLFREGVEDYFKGYLGRPEILNRFGQNIVVFDFMDADGLRQILERKVLRDLAARLKEQWGLKIEIEDEVKDQLMEAIEADVSMGGRLVGSMTEALLVNPLARALYAEVSTARLDDDARVKEFLAAKRMRVLRLTTYSRDGAEIRDIEYELA